MLHQFAINVSRFVASAVDVLRKAFDFNEEDF